MSELNCPFLSSNVSPADIQADLLYVRQENWFIFILAWPSTSLRERHPLHQISTLPALQVHIGWGKVPVLRGRRPGGYGFIIVDCFFYRMFCVKLHTLANATKSPNWWKGLSNSLIHFNTPTHMWREKRKSTRGHRLEKRKSTRGHKREKRKLTR
jgi:hypothetical protein